ncbi:MAG: hypothetical protein FJX29_10790 [Alphaproteobacteria bacterium]|nr:hypothetical protein [Alphaproteobacteria bacterium]
MLRRLYRVRVPLPPVLLPLGAAIIAIAAARGPAQAQSQTPPAAQPVKTASFVLPKADGYGISDCFKAGSRCGQVVSDSWCESNGWGKALAWGAAEDMTASLGAAAPKGAGKGAFVVTCAE